MVLALYNGYGWNTSNGEAVAECQKNEHPSWRRCQPSLDHEACGEDVHVPTSVGRQTFAPQYYTYMDASNPRLEVNRFSRPVAPDNILDDSLALLTAHSCKHKRISRGILGMLHRGLCNKEAMPPWYNC